MNENQMIELAEAALQARENAYAPYSGFAVGAALLCCDGSVYTGCNVESAAFSPTCCAERTALVKAVADGKRQFAAICIAGGQEKKQPAKFCPPCGVCRQMLAEFCKPGEFTVILAKTLSELQIHDFSYYFPDGFYPAEILQRK